MAFRDYFSGQAKQYVRYRPGYPPELFTYLADLAPARQAAWDSGTGNGQAARQLAEHFQRVIATDASEQQIENALQHERIEYRVERAEATSILASSIDLITSAVAAHWFDFEAYIQEVRRVSKPGAVIAVWTYQFAQIDPALDALIKRYYYESLQGYWPERIHYVENKYADLPFPFDELEAPAFKAETDWDLQSLAGFLDSWSGTQAYLRQNQVHPLEGLWPQLRAAWGAPERTRRVTWPLYLRVGRVE